jgi:CRISPR-associated protein Csb1
MSIDLSKLNDTRRLLFDVPLQPLQGTRFQPTGFPDLGAATYQAGDTDCLLVESAQSMANRLELQIWDEGKQELKECCRGVSYVRVEQGGKYLTSSLTDAHRINSPYILEGGDKTFFSTIRDATNAFATGPIDRRLLATVLIKFDANALIHGVFLAKKELAGGRLRVARALSACIEAKHIQVAASGGVKNDHVDPSGDTSKGFGNVPFHREEFTAAEITAFFNLDLEQIRGYGLPDAATHLLILLALYKIRSLLDGGLRLRTACDLCVNPDFTFAARTPASFALPGKKELESDLKAAITACAKMFGGTNGVTTVAFTGSSKKAAKGEKNADVSPATEA